MFGRRAVSTYGVLIVLAVAVASATGAPAFAADTPADAAATSDRSECPAADVAGGGSADAGAPGAAANGHSEASYPDAPHMDVARGDVAAIETGVSRSRTGTVRIESVDGEFNVTLTFANIDGRKPAVLYVNTYAAGNETAVANLAYTAGGGDRVAVEDRTSVDGAPLAPGAYDVTIERESGTERKRLSVDDPSVGDLSLLRAPGDRFDELDSDDAVHSARASGVVSDPPTGDDGEPRAALGDTMVYRLNASGLYGMMAAQGGTTAEENFLAVAGDEPNDRAFGFEARSSGMCGAVADVANSVDNGTMRVLPDPANETLYVTADLRRVATEARAARAFIGGGEASYTFFGGTHITDANASSDLEYAVDDREYEYADADGILDRETAPNQPVAGETTLAPHTRINVTVTAIGDDYDERWETTVDESGGFDTEIDLSEAPDDARFTLSIAEISGSHTLMTTGDATGSAVWFAEHESGGEVERIHGARVAVEDGGFLAAYVVPPTERVTPDDFAGRSEYLEAGVHNATVALDEPLTDSRNVVLVAHRDEDGDERFDYPADDSPYRSGEDSVYATGRALVRGDESTPPRDPRYLSVSLPPASEVSGTPVPTPDRTEAPTATPSPTQTPTPDDDPVGTTELPPPTLRGDATPTPSPTPASDGTTAPSGPSETTANGTAVNGTAAPNGTIVGNATATTDGATGGFGPGFGPVAALAAAVLLAAAALSRRP